jgi:hypothetical protein
MNIFQRSKKVGIIFVLIAMLFIRLTVNFGMSPVGANLLTYQTDFRQGTWTNRTGGTTTSTTGSPFTVNSNSRDFLLSYGTRDGSNNAYFGSLNNNNANSYFRLNNDHLIAEARTLLAPFDPLGNDPHEMVVASKTSFYFVSLTSMTLAWESIAAQAFTAKAIYSVNEGVSWQVFGESLTLSSTSPTSWETNFDTSYTGIQLGYYFSVSNLSSATFHVKNPVITIAYTSLSDEVAANAFKDEVVMYTPCVTDDQGLILLTTKKKTEFINKYNALNANAKSLFAGLSIGGGFTALDRYLLLVK